MESSLLILAKAMPVAFAALMPVVNPIGTAIILLGLTTGADRATQKSLARAIAFNSVVILTVILLGGSYLLSFFGISVPIVQVAGGFVLFAMGWGLLNQKEPAAGPASQVPTSEAPQDYKSQAFYPFTFPISVGPGSVAVALTLSAHTTKDEFLHTVLGQAGSFIGIIAIGMVLYLCLAYSNRVAARLGPKGLSVMMRFIAFIVVCIGAQIAWSGIEALLHPVVHQPHLH